MLYWWFVVVGGCLVWFFYDGWGVGDLGLWYVFGN